MLSPNQPDFQDISTLRDCNVFLEEDFVDMLGQSRVFESTRVFSNIYIIIQNLTPVTFHFNLPNSDLTDEVRGCLMITDRGLHVSRR